MADTDVTSRTQYGHEDLLAGIEGIRRGSKRGARRALLAIAATAATLTLVPAFASAATITPDVLTDNFTNDTDCSLREAISIANADSPFREPDCAITDLPLGDDVVRLPAGTYQLSLAGFDLNNASGDLNPDTTTGGALTIEGAGANAGATTIAGVAPERVIGWFFGADSLTVRNLTITGGAPTGASTGGAILAQSTGELVIESARVTGNSTGNGSGAGIRADVTVASLEIRDSVVSENTSAGGGVGISSSAPLTIESS
ncbi:MAG: hypothetical protein ACRDL6_01920, partial [Solirubrobacterales bacterium]